MAKGLRRNFLNGECGLNSDFCVVYAKSVSFVQGVFYFLFHCDIKETFGLTGGESDEQRQTTKQALCSFEKERF